MRSPLLIMLATSALAFTAACGASEEDLTGIAASPTATPAPTPTASPATPTPSPAPSASQAVVPADWATFTLDSVPEVTFRYPKEWYRTTPGSPSTLTSWDPASWEASHIPPGGVQVQLDRIRLDDPALEHRPDAATDVTIAGAPGWQITYAGTSENPAGKTRVIAIETKGYRYYLIGSLGEGADEAVFSLVAASFLFR